MREINGISGRNIGIYVRESRDENEENYETLETQRELLIDFVKRNNLGRIVRVYEDDNVSGSGFERRGINQLKRDVLAGNIDFLLIKDLSRLGRNNAKTLLFLDFLEEHGVRVVTFDGRYDSAIDNDTVGIETWFNERYLRDISRKIRANLRFKIEKGEYIGNAPYGYVKSTEQRNKLCIDPETAHVVREVYKLYREGYGYAFIAAYLNSKGYPPPAQRFRNAAPCSGWNPSAVRRILTNRVYIGDTVQGVSEKISFKSKKTRRLPQEKWVVTEGTHEPIISKEEFDEVQRIRLSRTQNTGPHKGVVHLLKGLAFCGRCGSSMIARSRPDRPMGYICSNYNLKGKLSCSSHHINEKNISDELRKQLLMLFEDENTFKKASMLLEEELLRQSSLDEEIERLKKQIEAKERQQEILYSDRLEGRITPRLFERINAGIEGRISTLRNEMERLKLKKNHLLSGKELLLRCMEILKEKGLTHEMVRLMVERITVFDENDDLSSLDPDEDGLGIAQKKGAVLIELRW